MGWRRLPHDHLAGLAPVPEQGKIGIDRINRVLPRHRKQDASRSYPVFTHSPLDRWLDSQSIKSAPLTSIYGMPIGTPRAPVEPAEFDVVTESLFVI